MSKQQREEGKKWVIETFQRFARDHNILINSLSWENDFGRDIWSLKFLVNEKYYLEQFTEEELEDCPNDTNIQNKLERRLKRIITSLVS